MEIEMLFRLPLPLEVMGMVTWCNSEFPYWGNYSEYILVVLN